MLLTLRVTGPHASDLAVLLDKCPDKLHTVNLPFGRAHVFFPEVSPESVTAALVVDVDAVDWSSNGSPGGFAMANAASLSVAIARALGDALAARCQKRPDLVTATLPIEARLNIWGFGSRAADDARVLFAPLGYAVEVVDEPLCEQSSASGAEVRRQVRLTKQCALYEILSHVYVLGPVLDGHAGDRVLDSEVETRMLHVEGVVRGHPANDRITQAYGARRVARTRAALGRLLAADAARAQTNVDTHGVPSALDDARMDAIIAVLRAASAHSVIDLGCGDGKLLSRLVREKTLTRIVGLDVSSRMVDAAAARMKLDRRGGKKSERLEVFHGSLFYKDSRLEGFDAAVLADVIQFVDSYRLSDAERVVFEHARPATVVVLMNGLAGDASTSKEDRFGWSTNKFDVWAKGVSHDRGYRLGLTSIGSGSSFARMAVFSR
jgi:3' terminal RNA ribose 2'-O-methyltransferase Hen1